MSDLFWFLLMTPSTYLSFFFFSLLFYDALIPKKNFKVFKEKIFLKFMIVCLFFYLVPAGEEIKPTHLFYLLSSLLVLQIFYSLYNRKKFQAWRKFDYCCILLIASYFLAINFPPFIKMGTYGFAILLVINLLDNPFFLLIASFFFAFKFSQRFYFYLKERKLKNKKREKQCKN